MTTERATSEIEARDDAPHEHGSRPGWSERLSFNFFDEASGFGGVCRFMFEPTAAAVDASVTMFVPGGAFATVLARGKTERMLQLSAGRLRFEQDEALRRWRIRCKDVALVFTSDAEDPRERHGAAAPVEIDLLFDAWTPPHGGVTREKEVDDAGFVNVVSSGHFEQAGRVSGRVRLGGRAATIDGAGARERTWGTRDGTARHSTRWLSAAFAPTLALSARMVSIGDRDLVSGWVWRDGSMRSIKTCTVEQDPGLLRARIRDDADEGADLEADLLASIPLREGDVRLSYVMARMRCSGREVLGLLETIRQR